MATNEIRIANLETSIITLALVTHQLRRGQLYNRGLIYISIAVTVLFGILRLRTMAQMPQPSAEVQQLLLDKPHENQP